MGNFSFLNREVDIARAKEIADKVRMREENQREVEDAINNLQSATPTAGFASLLETDNFTAGGTGDTVVLNFTLPTDSKVGIGYLDVVLQDSDGPGSDVTYNVNAGGSVVFRALASTGTWRAPTAPLAVGPGAEVDVTVQHEFAENGTVQVFLTYPV